MGYIVASRRMALVARAASCTVLALLACASDVAPRPSIQNEAVLGSDHNETDHRSGKSDGHAIAAGNSSAVQRLIESTRSNIFHLDLNTRGWERRPGGSSAAAEAGEERPPWFEGFGGMGSEAAAAAATVGHPIRRLLAYFVQEEVELGTALSWMESPGGNCHYVGHVRALCKELYVLLHAVQ